MSKRLLVIGFLALSLLTPATASATAFLRSGTIALDPASNLVNGGTAVIDATASGLKGQEYIVVQLLCSQGGVQLFEQDQQGSPKVTPPLQWPFPLAWNNADPLDCNARVWFATKSYGLISPLTDPVYFTVT